MTTVACAGDLGDSVFLLPVLKSLGSATFVGVDRPWCKHFTSRIHLIRDLFESQPYVERVIPHHGEPITYDASTFRNGGLPFGRTLAALQAGWVRVPINTTEPWLSVDPNPYTKGRIIVNKSPRYANPYFPWKSLVDTFGSDMLFVGLDAEYGSFCAKYGRIERLPTKDLLEVAQAIAGCELFIGNQSSPNSVCEGLKHRSILEICLEAPDCIYPRPNAIYCYDGSLKFSVLGKDFNSDAFHPDRNVNRMEAPPGGWRLKVGTKELSHFSIAALKTMGISECLSQGIECSDLESKILSDTISVHPNLGIPSYSIKNLPVMARIRALISS